MKRIVFVVMALAIGTFSHAAGKTDARIISRDGHSITFAVDEGLPAPTEHLKRVYFGAEMASGVARWSDKNYKDHTVHACSFAQDSLYSMGASTVFRMLVEAYAEHRPVVLSPDMVWLLICQALSHHICLDPDLQRDLIVDFEGKETLKVITGQSLKDLVWEPVVEDFAAQIASETKGGLARLAVADFSTTGAVEKVASQITLMDIVEPYFKYEVIRIVCGIPSVTLEGTARDWKALRRKAKGLSRYGLDWWLEDLDPVLKQFVKASAGHPDAAFWRDMVTTMKPDEVRGPGCGFKRVEPTKFDGWFLKLFPYDASGRTPSEVLQNHEMLAETVSVPVLYREILPGGGEKDIPLELRAGFVGVEENVETFALRPKIGWLVYEAE